MSEASSSGVGIRVHVTSAHRRGRLKSTPVGEYFVTTSPSANASKLLRLKSCPLEQRSTRLFRQLVNFSPRLRSSREQVSLFG